MRKILLALVLFVSISKATTELWLYDDVWGHCYVGKIVDSLEDFYIVYTPKDGYNKYYKIMYQAKRRFMPPLKFCKD